jgi:hypothetical protein
VTSKQKAKGKYFESKIASLICEGLNLDEYQCKRSPFSGNERLEFGDIYFSNPEKYGIIIECKFHNDWDMRSIWPTVGSKFLSFLDELYEAYNKYKHKFNREPIFAGVVFSKPYYDIYVLTWYELNIPVKVVCANTYNNNILYLYLFKDVLNELKDMI